MLKRFMLPLALCLAVIACKPAAGDDCDDANTGTCESDTEALFCDGGKYKLIHCRGANGCIETKDKEFICEQGNFRAGDPCLSSQENMGMCDASNANQRVVCRGGTVQADTCKGCAIQSGQIVCQP
jgi:hypothetical protein